MLNILIVEDTSEKASAIRNLINSITSIGLPYIEVAVDYVSAIKLISENKYDLLILDVVIPKRFGDTPKKEIGIELLSYMKLKGKRINKPHHIIGLSEFDDVIRESLQEFESELWMLIHYDKRNTKWEKLLETKVDYLYHSKTSSANLQQYHFDIGVICALHDPELKSVLNIFSGWKEIRYEFDSNTYYEVIYKKNEFEIKIVAVAAPQMGMSAASVLTTKVIQIYKPKLLFMTGIAAGIESSVNFGDVLVADTTWDYGNGKLTLVDGKAEFLAEPKQIPMDVDIKQEFTDLSFDTVLLSKIKDSWQGGKPDASLKIHVCPLASGAAVVANENILESLKRQQRKIKGIDMEAYGFSYACENSIKPRPKSIVIKSVSDYGDSSKNNDYRHYAAFTSAQILKSYIDKYYD